MPTPLDFARQEVAFVNPDGKLGVREPMALDKYAGGRDEAWCAHFVSWLYAQSGLPLPGYFVPSTAPKGMPPTAGCNYLMKRMGEFGKILKPGERPQPNDLIFYKRVVGGVYEQPGYYGFPFVYGHVGLVEGIEQDKKTGQEYVVTIEGNYSSKVARVKTKLNDPSIGAFARPIDFAKVAGGVGVNLLLAVGVAAAWRWRQSRRGAA